MPDRWWDEALYAGLGLEVRGGQNGAGSSVENDVHGEPAQCGLGSPSGANLRRSHAALRPLRIAHVCKFFPPERGGMETYVRDLAQEQAAAGHQVTVLAHTASASRRERMPEGYTVSRRGVWMRAGEYAPVAPGIAWDVWRAVRGGTLDILHVHCPNPAALWCVWLAGRGGRAAQNICAAGAQGGKSAQVTAARCAVSKRPRLVVHWHADVIFPLDKQPHALALQLWRRMERALLARADRIIATSQPYLDSSEFLAPWRSKCVVAPLRLSARKPEVPSGLRHPALDFLRGEAARQVVKQGSAGAAPENCLHKSTEDATGCQGTLGLQQTQPLSGVLPDTTRAVLAVGRLAHYKGFEVLVRAVAARPSLRCCIIGEGEEGHKLRALVRELGVQDRVLLPGEVDDATLAACYEACDVFCLPSILRTEAFGVVLLEALRAGKWCVVSNVPGSGMSTVIDDGVNGTLVPPGDVDALGRGVMINKLNTTITSDALKIKMTRSLSSM